MLEIPIRVGVSKEQADKAIKDFVNGARDSLGDIVGPGGYNIDVNVDFKSTGVREVTSEFSKAKTGAEALERSLLKASRTQEGSITSLRQSVNSLKQQRDALVRGSSAWQEYETRIKAATAGIRAQQGIQVGSLTDLRRQRDELVKLRDATARFPTGPSGGGDGPTWNDLNNQIKALDGSINKVTPGFSKFFNVLSRVATIQAGFIAITSAIGAIGGVINAYVGRTKQIEAFNLALKNVGLTQAATTDAFRDATAIANRLGAPVQQVEKSYQRMVPALRAVGANSATTSKFLENITARTQTLGLNTEESGRLLEAFAQVLSKGKLQSEELNQQISELDGAFRTQLADALGVTVEKLTELVETGAVTAPVFVEAVNKMSNGVDELQRRVDSGNATIQQFQNLIANINVSILQEIGKQIEPGIRAFLRLSLNVAKFFQEFSKTETFKAFTTIFNQSAKGIEVFVTNLLKIVNAINTLLSPLFSIINGVLGLGDGFGGLIGIIINVAGGMALLKGALLALNAFGTVTGKVNAFKESMVAAGGGLNYLAGTAKPGFLLNLKQGLEGVRSATVGMGKSVVNATSQFLGFKAVFETTGNGLTTFARKTNLVYGQTTLASVAAGTFAGQLRTNLAGAVQALINPLNVAIIGIGIFLQTLNAGKQEAAGVRQAFSGVFGTYEDEVKRIGEASKKVPQTQKELVGSVAQTSAAINKQSEVVGGYGRAWQLVTGVAVGAAIAFGSAVAIIGTGGAAAGVIASLAVASVAASKATKDLGQSAIGKALLENFKRADKAASTLDKRLTGLGVSLGQVDFSNLGPTNLREAQKTSQERVKGLREEIDALNQTVQAERGKEKSDQKIIDGALARKKVKEEELALQDATLQALSAEAAARIAAGDSAATQTASIEELTQALKLQNDAIDTSKLEAQTAALKKYGQLQSQTGQLEAANLGIELSASKERLKANQKVIDELNRRKAAGQQLSVEEKAQAAELTKTIAEETFKQTEIQKQLGDAIVAGFERGIQKAREIAGVYGQVATQAKSQFDGISGAVTTGLTSALSLVDAVAARELQGAQEGSLYRKAIILEQLRAAALVNEAEANIAKLKLAVQTRIAQNEARIAQIRLETEAKIAEARGEFDLAQAYREAASAQGSILTSLQQQYEIESKSIDLQRQAKDQSLIQKGLQEGIGKSANQAASFIGVQRVSLQQATGELKKMVQDSGRLVSNYGAAATKASDIQVGSEGQADAAGAAEAERVKQAFEQAKSSVIGVNQELGKTPDAVMAVAQSFTNLSKEIEKNKKLISEIDAILNKKATPARAMGGPVAGGSQYFVNDGGGREGFVNKFGNFSMLPAGRNINWTAPSSGMVIPAQMVDRYRRAADLRKQIDVSMDSTMPRTSRANKMASGLDSGNLVQRVASAMSGSGGTQRITNNVTIQSQEPVTDASKIMTNVARMKLRNARRM